MHLWIQHIHKPLRESDKIGRLQDETQFYLPKRLQAKESQFSWVLTFLSVHFKKFPFKKQTNLAGMVDTYNPSTHPSLYNLEAELPGASLHSQSKDSLGNNTLLHTPKNKKESFNYLFPKETFIFKHWTTTGRIRLSTEAEVSLASLPVAISPLYGRIPYSKITFSSNSPVKNCNANYSNLYLPQPQELYENCSLVNSTQRENSLLLN